MLENRTPTALRCALLLGLLATISLSSTSLRAQESATSKPGPLTESRKLLNATLEALGGADGYRKTLNCTYTGSVKTVATQPGLEVTSKIKVHTRADGARRVERELQGQKQIIATDGKNAWQQGPSGRVSPLSDAAQSSLALEFVLQRLFIDPEAAGYTLATSAAGTDPAKSNALELIFLKKGANAASPKPGDRFRFTVARAGERLPEEVSFLAADPWGGKPFSMTIQFGDYRAIKGIPFAHKITQVREGKTIFEIQIEQVELGTEPNAALFRRPQ